MKLKSIILTILIVLTITSSCSKKENDTPQFNVPGMKTSISKVLISPIAFDGAVIAIVGYVKDISISKKPNEPNLLILSDQLGNEIAIEFDKNFSAKPNEQILISGMFNRESLRIIDAKLYKFFIEDDKIIPLDDGHN